MLQACPAGRAVELSLGSDSTHSAFLATPITVPVGVSLIIDGGVTVYASRNPQHYQIPNADNTCGTVSKTASVNGVCDPFITFITFISDSTGSNSGIYGNGVIDGQGQRPLLVQPVFPSDDPPAACVATSSCSWWDLITYKDTHSKAYGENSPYILSAGVLKGADLANNLTLYKVTVRNPPYHTIAWGGDGLTAWGVHIMAPWNVPNTDGFDLNGTNITLYDTTISNGDDDVAIGAYGNQPTSQVTVRRVATYARGGLSILGNGNYKTGANISNFLFEDITQSANVPSLVANPDGTGVVNGVSSAEIQKNWQISDYHQALPNSTGTVEGLDIRYASTPADRVADISNINYRNVCIHDVRKALSIDLPADTSVINPTAGSILFQNVHVLAPTEQLAFYLHGILQSPSYSLNFNGVPAVPGQSNSPYFHPQFTLSNVVFDDLRTGGSSISTLSALGNELSTAVNIYPATLNALAAPPLAPPATFNRGKTTLTLSDNTYDRSTWLSTPRLANPCSTEIPFLTGDIYATVDDSNPSRLPDQPAMRVLATSSAPAVAANAETDTSLVAAAAAKALLKPRSWATVKAGTSVTLNAVIQPAMSQTTYYMPSGDLPQPGLVALGSPVLTNQVQFYEGLHLVGSASIGANGTLAALRLPALTPGLHLYTAQYPRDTYYRKLAFGLIAIYATR